MAEEKGKRLKKAERREYKLSIPADCKLASKYASIQVERDGVNISINCEIDAVR